jgi:SAM-dependent methyltransferase
MDEDSTVAPALESVPVAGAECLEAGAGAGNTSAALAERGAAQVYAVTNDPEHTDGVADRFADECTVAPIRTDLRSVPLPPDAVDVTTAHALFGVLRPAVASAVVDELTRVTAPGGHLVVVDYDPIQDDRVQELFALENAASLLADGEPALAFYPESHLQALFSSVGWTLLDAGTALEPVPWTAELLDAHAEIARSKFEAAGADEQFNERVRTVRERAGEEIKSGRMYYQTFRLDGAGPE